MGRKSNSTHIQAVENGIEVATMKLMRRSIIVVGVVTVVVSVLLGITYLLGVIINIDSASTGIARSYLRTIGTAIAQGLMENKAFPRDVGPEDINYQAGQSPQGHVLFNVEQMLFKYGIISVNDIPKGYFDADIWTVIKNLPDEPPPNLIVLATRNVDPLSLRTRITVDDMNKHIRFKENKDDLRILRQAAVLIYADGMGIAIPVEPPTSTGSKGTTYKSIYRDHPFDLTTNLVNGLQVKYLTPNGEAIPAND